MLLGADPAQASASAGVIDATLDNRRRQYDLAVEKRFRTEAFPFRLFTTVLGIEVGARPRRCTSHRRAHVPTSMMRD